MAATYTNFCCRSGGSNLNAGSRTGSTTEPGTAADFTYASGNWVASTGVFTVASGNPSSDGVAVGDFASVYADGSSVTGFVGRVTARDATTITVSLTAKAGTAPTDGTGNRTLKVGGAWAGPNGASAFPFGFVQSTLTDASGNVPRVNFKNDATYSITAAMTHGNAGPIVFEGYTSSYGDGGRATIDGGATGTGYIPLSISSGGSNTVLKYLIVQHNGDTSFSSPGISISGASSIVRGCVVNNVRGAGFQAGGTSVHIIECEAYACNSSSGSDNACFEINGTGCLVDRCIGHDNTTNSTSHGFRILGGSIAKHCIADSNAGSGFQLAANAKVMACDAYNNSVDGIVLTNSTAASFIIENCNLVKNGGYGINGSGSGGRVGYIRNCGFGSGTQVNTSGQSTGLKGVDDSGSITYAADTTPWVDPANGDFRINLSAAKGTGRGTFTQTAASYSGTVAYPDVGAAQHADSASTPPNYGIRTGGRL